MQSPVGGKQREYLGDIQTSSQTLLAIINDILDLATIDAGTFDLTLAPVHVEELMATLREISSAKARQRGIDLEIMTGAAELEFIADETRIVQVLNNVLTNAMGFSEKGDKVELRCHTSDDMIIFTVKDEGRGIPEQDIEKIFERFESKAKGADHRGAGLGLSIVKSIVELHHGDVKILSQEGLGTEIKVRFPLAGPVGKRPTPNHTERSGTERSEIARSRNVA